MNINELTIHYSLSYGLDGTVFTTGGEIKNPTPLDPVQAPWLLRTVWPHMRDNDGEQWVDIDETHFMWSGQYWCSPEAWDVTKFLERRKSA